MKKTLLVEVSLLSAFACLFAVSAFAQTEEQIKPINFRYSQNPKTKIKPPESSVASPSAAIENNTAIAAAEQTQEAIRHEPTSIAKKTLEIARKNSAAAVAPTEIYKVGVGDILFISLQNAPKDSTYYTVLSDGTIDYPLAGEMITVAGQTTDEIEETLRAKIKLYENPQISVGIRDYSSHKITVLGLVEKTGEKPIQREAVPLYVVRAEAVVQPKATQAMIRRINGAAETINLKDAKSDEILIFPGDIVEFTFAETIAETKQSAQFYYIGGEILSGGQKEFIKEMTLTQAILASGGLRKISVKRVVIRRKNFQGLLEAVEYNLKLIKEGKQPDPVLQPGDTIEIGL